MARTHTRAEHAALAMSQPVTLQMPESLPTSAAFDQLLPAESAVAPLTEMRDRSPERSNSSGASNQGRAKEPTSTACLACVRITLFPVLSTTPNRPDKTCSGSSGADWTLISCLAEQASQMQWLEPLFTL